MPEEGFLKDYFAIRNSVALEVESDLRCLLIRGREAFKLLDQVCPCNVYLHNGQMRHTLLLDEDAVPFADVFVCRNREDAYLLGYRDETVDLMDRIVRHQGDLRDYSITDLNESHGIITLNGPYAWELSAKAIGAEILGMPFLSVMPVSPGIMFRAGITGEYGYHLMVPLEHLDEWTGILVSEGEPFDLVWAGREARAQCTLENFFFDLNREGQFRLTPPELQLQWRLSRQKTSYSGSEAMQKIREKGWDRRITCFVTKGPAGVNNEIYFENEVVGQVLSIGYSPARKDYVGKALIRKPFWHSGLKCFHVNDHPLETISAPAIDNRSIHVNLNFDSYFTRSENEDGSVPE